MLLELPVVSWLGYSAFASIQSTPFQTKECLTARRRNCNNSYFGVFADCLCLSLVSRVVTSCLLFTAPQSVIHLDITLCAKTRTKKKKRKKNRTCKSRDLFDVSEFLIGILPEFFISGSNSVLTMYCTGTQVINSAKQIKTECPELIYLVFLRMAKLALSS